MSYRVAICVILPVALAAGCSKGESLALAAPPRADRAEDDPQASLRVLRDALKSRDYATRLLAAQALAHVRTVDVVPWLEHLLGDPEHDVRVAAVESLRTLGSRGAMAVLRTVRDDDKESLDVRALAASALLQGPQ